MQSKQVTSLTEACSFLWRDYDESMLFWDIVDIMRKIFLTGFINLIDIEEGSSRALRLIVAASISAMYMGVLALTRPYKRLDDLFLAYLSNLLLVLTFISGIILQQCEEDQDDISASCQKFIGRSFNSEKATMLVVGITALMLITSAMFIVTMVLSSVLFPTIKLKSTGRAPNLELIEGCKFHVFISHVWSTGQEKAQKMARLLQLFLPGVKIWIDVDELEYTDQLEESVNESVVFVIFYTEGYFESLNCRREIYAAVRGKKPVIIVYEDEEIAKEDMESECKRYCIEDNNYNGETIARYICSNSPILWLGKQSRCLYIESVKLVTLQMLCHFHYYKMNPFMLEKGLTVNSKLGPRKNSNPIKILYCGTNRGAFNIAEELKTQCKSEVSIHDIWDNLVLPQQERGKTTAFLLYLNEHTFLDDVDRLEKWVKLALQSEFQVVLAWEKDVNRGGCSFDTFLSQTPIELKNKDYNLYNVIAVPLYSRDEYRKAGLRLVLSKMIRQNTSQ